MIQVWEKEIYIAHLVKQKIGMLDVNGLWGPQHLPEVAADDAALRSAEIAIGHSLDGQYRSFLLKANGWRSFYQHVDLFGTTTLSGGDGWERAQSLLTSLELTPEVCGDTDTNLLPIAVSRDDVDLFLMGRPTSSMPGRVLWFAGELIEEFPDFSGFFLSMVDYNRREVEQLEAGRR